MWKQYYVYIMSNEWLTIYTGVTNNLPRRVNEHKSKIRHGFSQKYSTDRLVYFEEYADITQAIAREKQIKGWVRSKKLALIRAMNPLWTDLSSVEACHPEGAPFATEGSSCATRPISRSSQDVEDLAQADSFSQDDPSPAMKPRTQDDNLRLSARKDDTP